MKKIVNSVLVLSVLVFNAGCLNKETKIKGSTEKKFLKINFNEAKKDSNATLYIDINQEKNMVKLYTKKLLNENNNTQSNAIKGVVKNDEVNNILSESRISANDEVCMKSDSKIKEVTIVGLNDNKIIDMHKNSCIPLSHIKKLDGYKFNFKNEDGVELSIHIQNRDFSKEKSSI